MYSKFMLFSSQLKHSLCTWNTASEKNGEHPSAQQGILNYTVYRTITGWKHNRTSHATQFHEHGISSESTAREKYKKHHMVDIWLPGYLGKKQDIHLAITSMLMKLPNFIAATEVIDETKQICNGSLQESNSSDLNQPYTKYHHALWPGCNIPKSVGWTPLWCHEDHLTTDLISGNICNKQNQSSRQVQMCNQWYRKLEILSSSESQ